MLPSVAKAALASTLDALAAFHPCHRTSSAVDEHLSTMAANVPKFTSFRPKPNDGPEPDQQPAQQGKHSKASKPVKPEKHTKSEKPAKKERVRDDREPRPEYRHRSPDGEEEKSRPFFIDRRGDPDIARYGSLNRYEVPSYRTYGSGCVLGLPRHAKIDRELSTDKEVVLTVPMRRRKERLLAGKHTSKSVDRDLRFIKGAKPSTADIEADFIRLSATRKRKHGEEDEHLGPDYRGFEADPAAERSTPPDSDHESDTEASFVDAGIMKQNSALVRRTREHPQDLSAWLDLIDHQEAMLKFDRPSSELRDSDKRHLADIRISIYREALQKIGTDEAKQAKLYHGLMTEARKSWEDGQLSKKWTEILTRFPWNIDLWMNYLDFVQSSFSGFKYESCRVAIFRCLETLQVGSKKIPPGALFHILVRITSMIKHAGYQELAVAVWQALLEFHLLKPNKQAGQTLDEDLRLFGEFWESEVARVGEPDAKGWNHFQPDDVSAIQSGPSPLEPPNPAASAFHDFCKREVDSMNKLKYPGRTTDEVGEEDAFHTILFSDIEEFLKTVPREVPATALIQAFLCFYNLPQLPRVDSNETMYSLDPFLQAGFRKPSVHRDEPQQLAQLVSTYQNSLLPGFRLTIELLFDLGFDKKQNAEDVDFVRRVLKLLVADNTYDELVGEYLLALESVFFPSEAFKTAKRLLKARPDSLRLYNAYGLVESRRGNSTKADQVFSAALAIRRGNSTLSDSARLELFGNWVWEALRENRTEEAIWRLASPTGQVSKSASSDRRPDQATLLRARASLKEAYERSLLADKFYVAVTSASLLALLAYLSTDGGLEGALAIYDGLFKWFYGHNLSQSPPAELHAQSLARFLTYHATHSPIVKPSLLRTRLEPLLTAFPNNTIILALYAANEARFSIDDRVRAIMHQNLLSRSNPRNIVGWAFAIHHEMLRGEIAGSTSHSVRALFGKAEEDVGAHCPALWKMHVLFELEEARKECKKRRYKRPRSEGKLRREEKRVEEAETRVKETFFRGVTHLPWCKDFMMLAFTDLGREFLSREELGRVYNVMVEKELRLYVDVEDLDG